MSKRIAMATIGTQGDVQPFVALAVALKARGYSVVLGAPSDFEGFIVSHGIEFVSLGSHIQGFLTQSLFDDAMSRGAIFNVPALLFQGYKIIETATRLAWKMVQGADAIVLNMNTSFGVDFAEALKIPAIMVAPQPLDATREFPLCIYAGPTLGGRINRLSYGLMGFQQFYYNLPRNRLRRELMGLKRLRHGGFLRSTDGSHLPVLYCYSPLVAPRPADWPDTSAVTGYFRLKDNSGWQPSEAFKAFLAAGETPVYFGFGSMPFGAERNTEILKRAVELWGGRAVVARGWGGINPEDLPASIFAIEAAPHDKLFAHVRAVVHHGGAGTTAAGLTQGKPTFVVSQTVDQPFWGSRVHALGCGPEHVWLKLLTPEILAEALRDLTTNAGYARSAYTLAQKLQAEDGTGVAIAHIERILREAGATPVAARLKRGAAVKTN